MQVSEPKIFELPRGMTKLKQRNPYTTTFDTKIKTESGTSLLSFLKK